MATTKRNGRVVLITGASAGTGKICADRLHEHGYRVYGTSRRARLPTDLDSNGTNNFRLIHMDVDDDESVTRSIAYVLNRESRIDAVVNNAGYGLAGSLEDTSIGEAKAQFETNFFGAFRVCRAVLPIMREQRSGYIVNISSIGGLVGIPFQSIYSASKFALEGATEALRMEVEPFGIRVSLIEPGNFRTEFTNNRIKTEKSVQDSVYAGRFNRALETMANDEMNAPEPVQVALVLEKILNQNKPRLRYIVDPSFMRFASVGKRFLPYWLFETIAKKVLAVN